MHVHVTLMYVYTANLLNIKFISRVEINVILKPFFYNYHTIILILNIHLAIIQNLLFLYMQYMDNPSI